MRNNILHESLEKAMDFVSLTDAFVAKIDGNSIKSEKDWLYSMAEAFHFPVDLEKEKPFVNWFEGAYSNNSLFLNWEIYEDWMTDLSWIENKSIVLIIINYDSFLACDKESKLYIYNNLQNVILPWWENEVVNCVVEGADCQGICQ